MARGSSIGLDRRSFLVGGAAWLLWPRATRAAHHESTALSAEHQKLLGDSPFVYVSPLKSNGDESLCHGEVWYAWLDGSVYLNAASSTWKARAVASGLKTARVWVGDHGRWKSRVGSNNEAFRKAPHFDAMVERVTEEEWNDRLLTAYDTKYPGSIDRWRDKMRDGFRTGHRVLLRYTPA